MIVTLGSPARQLMITPLTTTQMILILPEIQKYSSALGRLRIRGGPIVTLNEAFGGDRERAAGLLHLLLSVHNENLAYAWVQANLDMLSPFISVLLEEYNAPARYSISVPIDLIAVTLLAGGIAVNYFTGNGELLFVSTALLALVVSKLVFRALVLVLVLASVILFATGSAPDALYGTVASAAIQAAVMIALGVGCAQALRALRWA